MSRFKFSGDSREMLVTLRGPLRTVMEEAIRETRVDFGIVNPTGGARTAEQQYELYLEGASSLDGYAKKSYHQTGWAVDVFAYANGRAYWDGTHMFEVIACIMQVASRHGLVLEWGGLWKRRDCPHLQVVGFFDPAIASYIPISRGD